jgi:hypothetical protein
VGLEVLHDVQELVVDVTVLVALELHFDLENGRTGRGKGVHIKTHPRSRNEEGTKRAKTLVCRNCRARSSCSHVCVVTSVAMPRNRRKCGIVANANNTQANTRNYMWQKEKQKDGTDLRKVGQRVLDLELRAAGLVVIVAGVKRK